MIDLIKAILDPWELLKFLCFVVATICVGFAGSLIFIEKTLSFETGLLLLCTTLACGILYFAIEIYNELQWLKKELTVEEFCGCVDGDVYPYYLDYVN
jgi:hypothetical protein